MITECDKVFLLLCVFCGAFILYTQTAQVGDRTTNPLTETQRIKMHQEKLYNPSSSILTLWMRI